MDPIQEGLTWREIQGLFDAEEACSMTIQPHLRRVKPWKRKKGEKEDRTVVRLIVQRLHNGSMKTIFRKNLRNLGDEYLDTVAPQKVVEAVNSAIATLAAV